MKKILFISQTILLNNTGGGVVSKRNLQMLLDTYKGSSITAVILGPNSQEISALGGDVAILDFRSNYSRISTFVNIILGLSAGVNLFSYFKLKKLIKKEKYDVVFFDGSIYGKLALLAYKSNARIISYYHNIEVNFNRDLYKEKGFIYFLVYLNVKFNEALLTKHTHYPILICSEEEKHLRIIYHRNSALCLPVSFPNRPISNNNESASKLKLLFVGSAFFANVEAANWFVKYVMPYVNAELTIVGKGMDGVLSHLNADNVKVIGTVEDLSPYYHNCHVVIAPISIGAGMKVKIAEALMYGKFVIGSESAFFGYEINSEVGLTCSDSNSYIQAINSYDSRLLFNMNCYNLFVEKYSYESILFRFRDFVKENNLI